MSNAEIVREMERICRKIGRTKDPHELAELDYELVYLNDMLEGGNAK